MYLPLVVCLWLWGQEMRYSTKCLPRVNNETGLRKVRNQSPLMHDDVKGLGGGRMQEAFDLFLKSL